MKEKTKMIKIEVTPIENMNLYAFGSMLYSNEPNDIDLALIYDKENVTIEEAINSRKSIVRFLTKQYGTNIDVLLLSKKEEEEAEFLNNAKHELIF